MSEDDLLHLLAAYRDLREAGEDDAAAALLAEMTDRGEAERTKAGGEEG